MQYDPRTQFEMDEMYNLYVPFMNDDLGKWISGHTMLLGNERLVLLLLLSSFASLPEMHKKLIRNHYRFSTSFDGHLNTR